MFVQQFNVLAEIDTMNNTHAAPKQKNAFFRFYDGKFRYAVYAFTVFNIAAYDLKWFG